MKKAPTFQKETDLCAAFISSLPKEWTAYPETGGFDILLSRNTDGFQIGIEAKLRLNAKVIHQAVESDYWHSVDRPGPDCRAVLIPDGVNLDLASLLPFIFLTPIRMRFDRGNGAGYQTNPFNPYLPGQHDNWRQEWVELCPARRINLPDWVPDVSAGASAPTALTPWKIKAIKIAVTLEKRGYVTRHDFKHFQISMPRWTQGGWIESNGDGTWRPGKFLPDFKAQHPVNYPQIEADFEKWKSPEKEQLALLGNAA